jgi:hypothetical protein
MAINTQRLLPQSKSTAIVKTGESFLIPFNKIKVKTTGVKTEKEDKIGMKKPKLGLGDYKKDLVDINKILIKIDKLLKSSFASTKKLNESKRRKKENVEFKKREDELEKEKPKGLNIKAPKTSGGFLSGIINGFMRFIFFVALGWLIPKLIKFLPVITGIFKVIGTIYKAVESVFGWLLDGLVGLIDLGFGIQDQFRGAIKAIGGEGAAKIFDNFNGVLSTLINTIVITGMLFSSGILDIIKQFRGRGKDCGPSGPGVGDFLPDGGDGKPRTKPGEKPRITGDTPDAPPRRRGPFSGIRDKIDEIQDGFRSKPKITGDAPRGPFSELGDKFKKLNPFQQKPKITGDVPGKGGFFKGIQEGFQRVTKWVGGVADGASDLYKNTVGKLSAGIDDIMKKGKGAVWKWLSDQPGLLGKLGKSMPDLLKRLGKYLPFVGDLVNFVTDLISGVDWRRALIRAVVGAGIDAGFNALVAALVGAAPFTGATSAALAFALYSAYMTADFASGGFGIILGDKIADFLKLPMKAGEKGGDAPPPQAPGTDSDLKKVQADIEKKKKEDPKFAAKISGQQPPQPPQTTPEDKTQKTEVGGLIGPKEETLDTGLSAQTRGGKEIGAELTRGGQKIGGAIKRSLKIVKRKPEKPLPKKKEEVRPGSDTRKGKESIIKLFGGSKDDDDKQNGFKTLVKASNIVKDIPFGIGTLMGSVVDVLLGHRPVGDAVSELSESISYLLKISGLGLSLKNELSNMFSFESGGKVPPIAGLPFMGEMSPDLLSKSLSPLVNAKLDQILQLVDSETNKKDRKGSSSNTGKKPTGSSGTEEEPITTTSDEDVETDVPKQSKQIVLHWTAGGYQSVVGPYHTIFTGDGKKHQKISYEKKSPGALYRSNAINLSLAAMGNDGTQWPTEKQMDAMAQEGANLAKAWGWSSSDINIKNVSGHGEVGAGKDVGGLSQNISTGRSPSKGPAGAKDNYGPRIWGGDGSRWDLHQLRSGQKGGDGEKEMRDKIKAKLGSAGKFHGGLTMGGIEKTHPKEFIIDADSVKLFGTKYFDIHNRVENEPQLIQTVPSIIDFLKGLSKEKSQVRTDEPIVETKNDKSTITKMNIDSSFSVPSDSLKTKPDFNFVDTKFSDIKLKDYSLTAFEEISADLMKWAKANRKMIEKVGTKKQKEILAQVDMQEKLKNMWKFENKKQDDNSKVTKMVSGGRIGDNKASMPSINKFTSDNNPYKGGGVFIQPIIEYRETPGTSGNMPGKMSSKSGWPYNSMRNTTGSSSNSLTLTTM